MLGGLAPATLQSLATKHELAGDLFLYPQILLCEVWLRFILRSPPEQIWRTTENGSTSYADFRGFIKLFTRRRLCHSEPVEESNKNGNVKLSLFCIHLNRKVIEIEKYKIPTIVPGIFNSFMSLGPWAAGTDF